MEFKPVTECRWHASSFQKRSHEVVSKGKQVLGNTALVKGGQINESDFEAIDSFFDAIEPNLNEQPHLLGWEAFVKHCKFSGEIAFELSQEINKKLGTKIDPYAEKASLKLHDLGRTGIHSFMETDELTDIYWEQIGIRKELKDLTHSAHLYWPTEGELDFNSLPVTTRISIVSDVFGKKSSKDPHRLRHKGEILESVRNGKGKYLAKPNPTPYEKELINRLPTYTKKEEIAISGTLKWLNEIGIDIDEIADKVFSKVEAEMALL